MRGKKRLEKIDRIHDVIVDGHNGGFRLLAQDWQEFGRGSLILASDDFEIFRGKEARERIMRRAWGRNAP